ncbi:hypothetical protein GA0061105_102279 [Rhizobium aethiopicum]|uniref:Endonuclease n=1 Tax=Rhizobium aethiopicum TaxID=1138170 RepID=A0A1C3XYG5_9HYPH|nr:hypothetical protein GA0061105_102279 [Rhizobium aethiopicum]
MTATLPSPSRSNSSLPKTHDRIIGAIARERQIKGWSRRQKEALIAMDYKTLPDLSSRGPVGAK